MKEDQIKLIVDHFGEHNITIPGDVLNVINDVYDESSDPDEIGIYPYFREEIEEFQYDLTLLNKVSMYLDGSSEGQKENNIWTYYGEISYAFNESTVLYKQREEDESLLEEVLVITSENSSYPNTLIEDPNNWCVVLQEKVSWDTAHEEDEKVSKDLILYIYSPNPSKQELNESDRFDGIYSGDIERGENE